jgi:hypothetical protein
MTKPNNFSNIILIILFKEYFIIKY